MPEQSPACPWCGRRVESEAVAVGPPPHLSTHHRFRLHERCLAEWHRFADRLFDLSRQGAGATLIEYPKNHGPEDLVGDGSEGPTGDSRREERGAGNPANAPARQASDAGPAER
ncbi:hypothetical protein [Saliphagus infecundisoli]|uniref:Uncharacterized protein n=1 Tax=Saliphagus infecundisoli TaxID=1849069 RepID=A0ABD5QK12_9EURY|nr:hypothetical protein [Saliphagus infecundisoli]